MNEILNHPNFNNIISLVNALGSIATFFAFLFLFRQQKTAKIQQFESSFFQLLSLHNEIITKLKMNTAKGDIFENLVARLKQFWRSSGSVSNGYGGMELIPQTIPHLEAARAILKSDYNGKVYKDFAPHLNHYFRNLYHIFKYINQTKLIKKTGKRQYIEIARAQLSQPELYAIMFNCMIEGYGNPNFLYLVKEQHILENFDHTEVDHYLFYELFKKMMKEVKKPKSFS